MGFRNCAALLLTLIASSAAVEFNYLHDSELCASGCGYALFTVSFNGQPAPEMSGIAAPFMACADLLWIQSVFLCSTIYCPPQQLHGALAAQNETCFDYLGMNLPPYSAPDISNVTMVSRTQATSMTFKQPVVPDHDLYQLGYKSSDDYNYVQETSWDFIWGLYGFWGLVFIIGIANRALNLVRNFSSSTSDAIEGTPRASAGQGASFVTRSNAWFQRVWTVPFAFGSTKHLPAADCPLPTRLETALIVFYIVLNFVFCFPGYHLLHGDTYLSATKEQLAKGIANRLGSLAMGNIPVVWIFAMRNDPLLWLTGWSYTTYSQFHRWAARMLLLLIIGHATANSVNTTYFGRSIYYGLFDMAFFQWGLVGILSLSILVGSSFYFIRNKVYDLWYIIHFVFAAILIIAAFYHTKEVNGKYNGFLWFAVAIWAFDRVLRLARLISLNLHPTTHGARATVSYDPSTDMIRVDATPFFGNSSPPPGAYYFLYEPARLRGYESHPFSLCSWPSPRPSSRNPSLPSSDSEDEKARTDSDDEKVRSDSDPSILETISSPSSRSSPSTKHTFLIKPRKGFTARLRKLASASAAPVSLPILLEGPYGAHLPLERYPHVTIVVGGSGISAAVSRVHDLLGPRQAKTGRPRSVRLIWAAREGGFVADVLARELAGVVPLISESAEKRARGEGLSVEVFITGQGGERVEELGAGVKVVRGRPDVYELLREERTVVPGPLAVLVCGPAQLTEGTHKAVARLLGEKNGSPVGFFDERFGW